MSDLSDTNVNVMLSARVTQYNRTAEQKAQMGADDVDMAVQLRMQANSLQLVPFQYISLQEMRFVFLNAWLNRLLCWVAPFQQGAAEAAAQAQARYGEQAREAAQVQHVRMQQTLS